MNEIGFLGSVTLPRTFHKCKCQFLFRLIPVKGIATGESGCVCNSKSMQFSSANMRVPCGKLGWKKLPFQEAMYFPRGWVSLGLVWYKIWISKKPGVWLPSGNLSICAIFWFRCVQRLCHQQPDWRVIKLSSPSKQGENEVEVIPGTSSFLLDFNIFGAQFWTRCISSTPSPFWPSSLLDSDFQIPEQQILLMNFYQTSQASDSKPRIQIIRRSKAKFEPWKIQRTGTDSVNAKVL